MSGMRLTLMRCLLSPVTSWQAHRMVRASGGRMDFDVAWRRIRLARHPDELAYQQHGHQRPADRERRITEAGELKSPVRNASAERDGCDVSEKPVGRAFESDSGKE